MKTLILIPFLFCFLEPDYGVNKDVTLQENNQIKGEWKSERIQIQYMVDSHLVFEREVTAEKNTIYKFDDKTVQVKYPDGRTAQGTYSLVKEAESQNLVVHVSGTTTNFLLISVTPTYMVWQKDLDNVNYTEGKIRKSAERAIYIQVFKKVNPKKVK